MKIQVKRFKDRIQFFYSWSENDFSFELEFPDCSNFLDDSLFRLAIFSRPANSRKITVSGVTCERSTRISFEKEYRTVIKVTDGELSTEEPLNISNIEDNWIYLSFSGGFDSIASKAISPKCTKLISQDFGGDFKRESDFFSIFSPIKFTSTLRNTPPPGGIRFKENTDWRFMIAPAVCMRQKNKPVIISTGTILEASPYWFNPKEQKEFTKYSNSGFGPNVFVINPVACLSEYATTKIAIDYLTSELLEGSLKSLADEDSIKYYRKRVLISIAKEEEPPIRTGNEKKHVFGRGYGDDIVSMYLVFKLGYPWVKNNYCENIPEASRFLNMSFFERYNPENLKHIDPELRCKLATNIESYGFVKFNEADFISLSIARDFLNDYTQH